MQIAPSRRLAGTQPSTNAADPEERRGLLPATGLVTQSEDVLVDNRRNIFITDKNHGIYVLRFNGI